MSLSDNAIDLRIGDRPGTLLSLASLLFEPRTHNRHVHRYSHVINGRDVAVVTRFDTVIGFSYRGRFRDLSENCVLAEAVGGRQSIRVLSESRRKREKVEQGAFATRTDARAGDATRRAARGA